MSDLVCVGELLIDFVPTTQGYRMRDVKSFVKAAGGAPANVSVGFSRLGGTSRFIGKVGEDEFGYFLEETLQNAKVDTTYLYKTKDALTTLAFVSLRSDGERDFIFCRDPGADMLLRPEEVNLESIREANVFHFGSISLMHDPSRSATLKLAKLAVNQGKLVSFDPNLRAELWPDLELARTSILSGTEFAHIVKLSDDELAFLVGDGPVSEGIATLFSTFSHLQLIAVTLGQHGCVIALRNRKIDVPGFKVDAVDTTGAGDGFTACLLYALNCRLKELGSMDSLWNEPNSFWVKIGRFANAAGALVVTKRGGIPSMPDYVSVQNLVDGH